MYHPTVFPLNRAVQYREVRKASYSLTERLKYNFWHLGATTPSHWILRISSMILRRKSEVPGKKESEISNIKEEQLVMVPKELSESGSECPKGQSS